MTDKTMFFCSNMLHLERNKETTQDNILAEITIIHISIHTLS